MQVYSEMVLIPGNNIHIWTFKLYGSQLSTFGVTGKSESEMAKLEETTKNGTSHGSLMAGIKAEAIKHNVSLTVHEAKYIDLGWTGIATLIKAEWQ